MNLLLLLLHLTSTLQGIFTGETPPAVDETEEEDNFTLRWDNPTQTNMSLTDVICYLLLNPPKVLYNMVNGAEIPESQDGQFSGRVQLEKDALREGRLRLHLSRLRTADSGSYRCYLAAEYNQVLRRWELQTSVTFVLNVTKTSNGDSYVTLNTSKPGPIVTPDKKQLVIAVLLVTIILLFWVLLFVFRMNDWKKMKRSTKNADNLVDMKINNNSGEMNFMIKHSADRPPANSAPQIICL